MEVDPELEKEVVEEAVAPAGHRDLDEFRREWRQEVQSRYGRPHPGQQERSAVSSGALPQPGSSSAVVTATAAHGQASVNKTTADDSDSSRHDARQAADSSAASGTSVSVPTAAAPTATASAATGPADHAASIGTPSTSSTSTSSQEPTLEALPSDAKVAADGDVKLSPRSFRRRRDMKMQQMHKALQKAIGEESDDESERAPRQSGESATPPSCEDGLVQQLNQLDVVPQCEPESPTAATHFCDLPVEIVVYIFQWVVSTQVDVYCLEQLSVVCRWFYLCARSERLWRSVCRQLWVRLGPLPPNELTWRGYYLNTPHPLYHGCYISANVYYRSGQRSLDDFYKPYHSVVYYRYVRFFPDGTLLIGQGAPHPKLVVKGLQKGTPAIAGVEINPGTYSVAGDQIMASYSIARTFANDGNMVHGVAGHQRHHHDRHAAAPLIGRRVYNMTWQLQAQKHQLCRKLVWQDYNLENIHPQRGVVLHDDIELGGSFPALSFSRVRNYTQTSNEPLP